MQPRFRLRPRVLSVLVVALGVVAVQSCGLHAGYDKLPNGELHVACKAPLLVCLEPAANACAEHGYEIVAAHERRDTTGGKPYEGESILSEATLRCRAPTPLFGHTPSPPPSAVASAPAAPVTAPLAASAPHCVPGVSQACVTPTCSGAQLCTDDGSRFGPCECAASSSASAPSTSPAAP